MDERLLEELRRALPRLVREHPEIVAEIQVRLRDAFASKDDLRAVIEAFDRRTEAQHAETLARFEAMQADMDRRFEAMDRRFEAMQADMDRRFEAMDRRFEAMDRRFEAMDKRFELLSGQISVVNLNVGQFVRRSGHKLEDTVAGALRFALARPDIRADQVRLRQEFVDRQGRFGKPGRKAEIDIVAANGRTYLLEVKAFAKARDVRWLADDAAFIAQMADLAPGTFEVVLATMDKSDEVVAACREHGITLV
jgi:hypothetical protein